MEAMVFVMVGLVIAGFAAYLFLMLFYPEWVGITGKSARQTMSEHEEGSHVDDSDPFSSESKKP
jgi:hypothetical protein